MYTLESVSSVVNFITTYIKNIPIFFYLLSVLCFQRQPSGFLCCKFVNLLYMM